MGLLVCHDYINSIISFSLPENLPNEKHAKLNISNIFHKSKINSKIFIKQHQKEQNPQKRQQKEKESKKTESSGYRSQKQPTKLYFFFWKGDIYLTVFWRVYHFFRSREVYCNLSSLLGMLTSMIQFLWMDTCSYMFT